VRIGPHTPTTLWSPRQSQTLSDTRSSKACLSSRVPGVRAFVLTWVLPLEVLFKSASIELWAYSECAVLRGSVAAGGLQSVAWPKGLKRLVLNITFTEPMAGVTWPASRSSCCLGSTSTRTFSKLRGLLLCSCFRSGMTSINRSQLLRDQPSCSSCCSASASTSRSPELCGRLPFGSYRSGSASTSLSWKLRGRPSSGSSHWGMASTSPSQGLRGRLRCSSYRLGVTLIIPSSEFWPLCKS